MPGIKRLLAMKQYFHSHRAAPAKQAGGNHAGVVDHKDVAGAQQAWEIADCRVPQAVRSHTQQPRRLTRNSRPLRDTVVRKLEIE